MVEDVTVGKGYMCTFLSFGCACIIESWKGALSDWHKSYFEVHSQNLLRANNHFVVCSKPFKQLSKGCTCIILKWDDGIEE